MANSVNEDKLEPSFSTGIVNKRCEDPFSRLNLNVLERLDGVLNGRNGPGNGDGIMQQLQRAVRGAVTKCRTPDAGSTN
jgi:hypothetical protein